MYKVWDRRVITVQREIETAIDDGNKAMAIGAVMAFAKVHETFGSTKQAEFLLRLAQARQHTQAERLISTHLAHRSALSGDNNFICQAAWLMAGGESPVAEDIEPVTLHECERLLNEARERWKDPQPIPGWCLDGIHSAGSDTRFTGCLPEMWAVCRAFEHYGRLNPDDEWLPEFQCYDGLIFEQSGAGAV